MRLAMTGETRPSCKAFHTACWEHPRALPRAVWEPASSMADWISFRDISVEYTDLCGHANRYV